MPNNELGAESFYVGRLEILVRRFLVLLRNFVDDKYFYAITSQLKRIRAFFRGSKSAAEDLMNEVQSSISENELIVCITHDIDSLACSLNLQNLLDITDNNDIRTTINVLTEGPYDLKSLLLKIPSQHEIGLHGDFHDIAFGFRKTAEINERLGKCIQALSPLRINSYRAPGLGVSLELVKSLKKFGITIDSSLASWPLYKSQTKPILYSLLSGQIFEVPLAISDDLLFRELKLNGSQAIDVINKLANVVAEVEGILVLNFHPGVTAERLEIYREIIDHLAKRPHTKFETISGAVKNQISK